MALRCLGLSTQRQKGVQSLGAKESHVYFQQREPGQQPIVWQLGWGRMEISRLGLSMLPSPPGITLYWWVPFLWGSLNCTVARDLVRKSVCRRGGSALRHKQHLAGGFPSVPIILQDSEGGQSAPVSTKETTSHVKAYLRLLQVFFGRRGGPGPCRPSLVWEPQYPFRTDGGHTSSGPLCLHLKHVFSVRQRLWSRLPESCPQHGSSQGCITLRWCWGSGCCQ